MLPLVGALPCQGFALQLHGACKSNPDMESQFRRRFCRGSKPAGISTAARMRKSSFGLGWVGHTCLMKLCIIGGFNRKTWRGLAQAGLLFEASTSSCNVRDFNTPGSIARSWLLVVSRVLRGRSGSHEGLPLGLHAPLVRPAGAPPLLHPAGEAQALLVAAATLSSAWPPALCAALAARIYANVACWPKSARRG